MIVLPTDEAPLITTLEIESGRAAGFYEVRLMKEGDRTWITPEKARALWIASKEHDVLFSDYTRGKPQALLRALSKSNSVWAEVTKDEIPVGILYMHRVIPHFDGVGHFAFWDKVGRGREPLILDTLRYMMMKFDLRRVSAEPPVNQKGTIRMIKRLGFEQEGRRRMGVIYKNEWVDQLLFGLLREDLITVEIETGVDAA